LVKRKLTKTGIIKFTVLINKRGSSNLKQRKNNLAGVTEDFLYDKLYRLTQTQSKYSGIATPVTKTIGPTI
jgi:hypothetical protein